MTRSRRRWTTGPPRASPNERSNQRAQAALKHYTRVDDLASRIEQLSRVEHPDLYEALSRLPTLTGEAFEEAAELLERRLRKVHKP